MPPAIAGQLFAQNGASEVIPVEVLERVQTPSGELVLSRRDQEYSIRIRGIELMCSRNHGSEDELGTQTCERLRGVIAPRVLVGGLGLGFTLRAALDALPADAAVDVVEIIPEVLRWNREIYGALSRHPLTDPRVNAICGDVAATIAASAGRYHAILLDVDNGPDAVLDGNEGLYKRTGLERAHAALVPGGVLAVWSAFESTTFTRWLRGAGFAVEVATIRSKHKGGPRHHIWFAKRR